jgi:dTDP-4-amino-4,6-dideoxygalactose transaminase
MKVPLLDLVHQYQEIREEVRAAADAVMDRQEFIMGREVKALEAELAADLGVRHALAISSGTDALFLALWALGIGPGDEVLVPSFTFFATAGAVSRLGATPVFVDVEFDTMLMDLDDARRKVTGRTRAVLPVHLFGAAMDLDALRALCEGHGLHLVEDCAQSIGAAWKGRATGSVGRFGCFSFFPSKNLGAFGDGGLLTSQDDDLADHAALLRVHGARPKYHHHVVGGNFRLDELQAAILRVKRRHLARWNEGRARVAGWYDEHLGIEWRQRVPAGATTVWHQFTVTIPEGVDRDHVQRLLHEDGVGTAVYYPVPLHEQGCFRQLGYQPQDLPNATTLARRVLSLPIDPSLREEQVAFVAERLRHHCGRA